MWLRLSANMVPEPIWWANLRNAVRPSEWNRIRLAAYRAAGMRCAVCGARGRLYCHERWNYVENIGVARLVGFEALCALCHGVRHLGAVELRLMGDAVTAERVAEHACRVNGCTLAEWERHEAAAWLLWERRSKRPWRVDLGRFAALVPADKCRGRFLRPPAEGRAVR